MPKDGARVFVSVTIKRARGRPARFDRDAFVARAGRLFRERGYDAVGVAELCAEAGVKAPSLYAAYGSKAGLFARAVAAYQAAEGGALGRALCAEATAADAIRAGLLSVAEELGGAGCGCLVMEAARYSDDVEARAFAAERRRLARASLAERIARDRPDRAEEVADFVMVALAGLSAAAQDGADPASLHASATLAAEAAAARLDA